MPTYPNYLAAKTIIKIMFTTTIINDYQLVIANCFLNKLVIFRED